MASQIIRCLCPFSSLAGYSVQRAKGEDGEILKAFTSKVRLGPELFPSRKQTLRR